MEQIILHLSDWNYTDKYYSVPQTIFNELKTRLKAANHQISGDVWDWFVAQVSYNGATTTEKPILYATKGEHPDTELLDVETLEEYFLDWSNVQECVAEWDDELYH